MCSIGSESTSEFEYKNGAIPYDGNDMILILGQAEGDIFFDV